MTIAMGTLMLGLREILNKQDLSFKEKYASIPTLKPLGNTIQVNEHDSAKMSRKAK